MVGTYINYGLNPNSEFAELIVNLAEHINKKKQDSEYNPRDYIDDERWLLDSQGPKTFYYLDEAQINDLYSQINQNSLLEYTEREKSALAKEGGVTSKPLVIRGNKTSESEKTSRFQPDNSTASKYSVIENFLKENELLNYSFAQFYTNEYFLLKFHESCNKLEEEFNYKISKEERSIHWINLNKENAYPSLEKIKLISGNIAIQQNFIIEEFQGLIKLNFDHPINEYLEEKDRGVKICINCSKESLTPSGKTYIVSGKTIKATCIGKVIRWDEGSRALEINPIVPS